MQAGVGGCTRLEGRLRHTGEKERVVEAEAVTGETERVEPPPEHSITHARFYTIHFGLRTAC